MKASQASRTSFPWNKWLLFYGLCFLLLHFRGIITPPAYCGFSLVLICLQGALFNSRQARCRWYTRLLGIIKHYVEMLAKGANMFFGSFVAGDLDNRGFIQAVVEDRAKEAKGKEDEALRRAFYESYRRETELRRCNGMNKMMQAGLTGGGYGGVTAQHAMAGLSNIKQFGLSAPQSNALSAGVRSHYDFMRKE